MGDDTNKHFKEVEHYPITDFFESAERFQNIYIHQSPNPYGYELFCFQRWFIVKDFIQKQGISHFLCLDSDVLIYCNVNEVFNEYLNFDFTICNYQAPCSTLFNKKALNEFCDFIQKLYTNEYYTNILEQRYKEFINKQREMGNSDMTAFELIQKYKTPKVKELTIINNHTCFDDNIGKAGNFEKEKNGLKKIYWINDKPHARLRENQQLTLFYSLHFQGRAKHFIYNYRINFKQKHVGGILYRIKLEYSFKRIIKKFLQSCRNKAPEPLRRLKTSYVFDKEQFLLKKSSEVFKDIYNTNLWVSQESKSGTGSTVDATAIIREHLPLIINNFDISSMLDVPCGDYNWMKFVPKNCRYIGGDIVPEIVANNQILYSSDKVQFKQLDITMDEIPQVDLIFCRDCLQHLSYKKVKEAINNFKRSGSNYLLVTSYPKTWRNYDIYDGDYRPLNLLKKPFYFPKPLLKIREGSKSMNIEIDKTMYLYKIESIRIYN
ncbi:MAG: class I SAM-dependent methyltransferase [Dysgonamonadaceae bacterium]|nr:class I SAM-dependent methyltransferase [Dysgonamonadaceae bacterium]